MDVVIFGASGMVGQGVLRECLRDAGVARVVAVGRTALAVQDPKLEVVVVADLADLSGLEDTLRRCDACFFPLGVSSSGLDEARYTALTHDLTLAVARQLAQWRPGMVFTYVSGAGTDSSEHGRSMWARVKGRTENELLRLFPRGAMFRPGMMKATPGQRNLKSWYHLIAWIYPVGRALWPAAFCTLREVAQAMINAAVVGSPRRILEVPDIVALAHSPER